MLQTIASNAAADSTEAQLETIAKKLVNTALTCDDEKDLEEEYDAKDSVEQSKVEKMEEEQLVKELPSISNDEDDVESKEEQDLESLSSVDPMDEEALIASKSFGIELQSAIDHVSSIAKDHREEMMSSIRLQIEEETKQDLGTLKEILDGGKDKVSAKNEEALKLLTKLHQAVNMNPKGHSKNKRTLARLKVDKIDKGKDEEKDKEVKLPAKYRVVIHPGALCKETKELSSKEVCKLPIGTVVTVVEIDGRRARVTSPSRGWLSLHASDGRIILQRSNTKSAAMDKAIHAERARLQIEEETGQRVTDEMMSFSMEVFQMGIEAMEMFEGITSDGMTSEEEEEEEFFKELFAKDMEEALGAVRELMTEDQRGEFVDLLWSSLNDEEPPTEILNELFDGIKAQFVESAEKTDSLCSFDDEVGSEEMLAEEMEVALAQVRKQAQLDQEVLVDV